MTAGTKLSDYGYSLCREQGLDKTITSEGRSTNIGRHLAWEVACNSPEDSEDFASSAMELAPRLALELDSGICFTVTTSLVSLPPAVASKLTGDSEDDTL